MFWVCSSRKRTEISMLRKPKCWKTFWPIYACNTFRSRMRQHRHPQNSVPATSLVENNVSNPLSDAVATLTTDYGQQTTDKYEAYLPRHRDIDGSSFHCLRL